MTQYRAFNPVVALLCVLGAAAGLALLVNLTAALFTVTGGVIVLIASRPLPAPPPAIAEAPDEASVESPAPQGSTPVIEAIAEPVLMVAGNRVIEANSAARTLLGEHILGEDVRLAIRHPAATERLADTGGDHDGEGVALIGLGVRDQRWEMRVSPVENGRRIVQLIDRTGSYAAERMRIDFVASASHELKTPLASILGFIETLSDPEAGSDARLRERFLKVMAGEAARMQRLVDDLLSLSRIEAEKYAVPTDWVDIADLAETVVREVSEAGDPRAGDIVLDSAPDIAPLHGDRAQLSQMLHNVISNAMKYGRPGSPVTVSIAQPRPTMVRVSVADLGEGIPPEHVPRLTERFYRVDPGRSRAVGGTGLGLAIVKHIVERHRGRLDIASVRGMGTTVTLMLPADGEATSLSSKRHEAAASRLSEQADMPVRADQADPDIGELRGLIAEMGGLAEAALDASVDALVRHDLAAAQRVIAGDRRVDALESQVERLAIRLIALRAPTGGDLREAVAALKIAAVVERIGDYAKNIAKRVSAIDAGTIEPISMLPAMARMAGGLVHDVLDAFAARDAAGAIDVAERDRAVDDFYDGLFRLLVTYMMENPQSIGQVAHLLFIAKNLERVGDHATNVAEMVHYAATGDHMPERERGASPIPPIARLQ
jgi:two-component system phosphate regulon sensor histidine kinase PhoR